MTGVPAFDPSSHGHGSGLAVPSEGAHNAASLERPGAPGLPGERGYIEPRYEAYWEAMGWEREAWVVQGHEERSFFSVGKSGSWLSQETFLPVLSPG